jgi:hypothetical protein
MKALGATLVLLTAACGGRADVPLLKASYDPRAFDFAGFEWTHPPGEAPGGYALEARIVPQPFQVASTVGPSQLSVAYSFIASEQLDFEFRVRALPDENGSRASNIVAIRRGIRQPALSCAASDYYTGCQPNLGAFELVWSMVSQVADTIRLERRVRTLNTANDWVTLPVAYPATSYRDTDMSAWSHGAFFEYRLTTSKGAEQSVPATARTMLAPP